MAQREVVVIGASAGGLDPLRRLVRELPATLPAAVVAVMHYPAGAPSALPEILARTGPLPAKSIDDGEPVRPATIYVGPPGYHVVIVDGHLRLTKGPRENGHRPAIDVLFRSAAHAYGSRVVGVVLSGMLDDGTAGLTAIEQHGGVTIVQDPADATFGGMPQNAIAKNRIDHIWDARTIGQRLARIVGDGPQPDDNGGRPPAPLAVLEVSGTESQGGGLTCPDCGGRLHHDRESRDAYRCRTGHAFGLRTLLSKQNASIELAIWNAVRTLEERADVLELLDRDPRSATSGRAGFLARETRARATTLRHFLESPLSLDADEEDVGA